MTSSSHDAAELRALLERLREQRLTPAAANRLEEIVLNDAAAMDVYVRYMAMVAGLRARLGRAPAIPPAARADVVETAPRPARPRITKSIVAASLAAVAGLICFWLMGNRDAPDVAPAVTTLDHVSGNVVVERPAGHRAAVPGMAIASGETLRSRGARSLARLAFGDGTTILLVGEGALTYAHRGSIHLTVQKGSLAASVAPQPHDKPMIIKTPTARVRVLGTEFSLSATRGRTELEVTKGRVELIRTRDSKSVVVDGGKRAATGASATLGVHDIQPVAGEWEEDFENGAPPDWQAGKFVSRRLPAGSQGAVQAVRAPEDGVYSILSPHAWMDGLFTVHPDSHLHLTFKMDRPNWVNVFYITRTGDLKDPTTFLHKFDALPFGPARPGVWWTATIPFTRFQRLTKQGFEYAPVQAGGLVFGISWTAPGEDRGMVIDRVWVTRGGPGNVEFREAATKQR